MKRVLFIVALASALAGCTAPPAPPAANGTSFTENFDSSEDMPRAWTDVLGSWELIDDAEAPSAPHVLQQSAMANDSFPHIIANGTGTFGDVEISVKARPIAGYSALSAGIIFRYVDSGNYYVARLSGAEQNVRFFEYAKGVRTKYDENFERAFPVGNWTELKVRAVGDAFTVWVDGAQAFVVHDKTLQVGNVGLWVKDDSVSQFDDVRVTKL